MYNETKRLTISQSDLKECRADAEMRLYQMGLMRLVNNTYVAKNDHISKLLETIMVGLQVDNVTNSYRESLNTLFGDKADRVELSIGKALRALQCGYTPKLIYTVITNALYKEYGDFY